MEYREDWMRSSILLMRGSPALLRSVAIRGFKPKPHEAEQHRLKYDIVVFVQRAVYEDASLEVVVFWQIALSGPRTGIVCVGVAPPKTTVPPENEDFAPLISGNSAGGFERFLLGVEVTSNPFGTRLANCPPLPARNNILALV